MTMNDRWQMTKQKSGEKEFFLSNSIHIVQHPATPAHFGPLETNTKKFLELPRTLHCLEKEDVVRAEEYTNHRRGWLYRLPRGHSLRKEVPALQGESLYRLKSGADV